VVTKIIWPNSFSIKILNRLIFVAPKPYIMDQIDDQSLITEHEDTM
jgi:hypothetical protein